MSLSSYQRAGSSTSSPGPGTARLAVWRSCSGGRRAADNRGVCCRSLALAILLSFASGVLAAPLPPAAPPSPSPSPLTPPPAIGARLVHVFNFEERAAGNVEDLPRSWYPIGRDPNTADPNFLRLPLHRELTDRPGYPRYNRVAFETNRHASGEHSFGMTLEGGSAGAFLQVGAVPAVAETDYLISARVGTRDLKRGSARVTAYLVDESGQRVEGTLVQSPPVRSGVQEWETLTLTLRGEAKRGGSRGGDREGPAWIGLELEVLQPEPEAGHPLGSQQVTLREIDGRAWFDDISISRLPRVEVWTQGRVGVVRSPGRPRVTASVRDLAVGDPMARLRAYDIAGRRVDETTKRLTMGTAGEWSWSPRLPRFGWYLIELAVVDGAKEAGANRGLVLEDAQPVAKAVTAVAWLGHEAELRRDDGARFMLDTRGAAGGERELLPELMRATGLRSVTLGVWSRETTLASLAGGQAAVESLLGRLAMEGVTPTLSLSPLPEELARDFIKGEGSGSQTIEEVTPLDVLSSPRGAWEAWVGPVLMRQGQQVSSWSLGDGHGGGGEDAASDDADDADVRRIERALSAVRELAPSPTLRVAWPLISPPRSWASGGVEYVVRVPSAVMPEAVPEQLAGWSGAAGRGALWLELDRLPADEVAHPGRVEDLALRMIHAWRVEGVRLSLHRPWTDARRREAAVLPDPLLGVFASVSHRLAGRRVAGEMPAGPGVRAMILQDRRDPAKGALAVWSEAAGRDAGDAVGGAVGGDEHPAQLHLDLGGDPHSTAVDVWGNRRLVDRSAGLHRVALTTTPQFIEGIDPRLALLRAGFVLDQPFIESIHRPHRRMLTLTNPWAGRLAGRFELTAPRGWEVTPREHRFSIPPGDTQQVAVTLTPPVADTAGDKSLRARFVFTAGETEHDVELTTAMELGITGLEYDATLVIDGDEAQVRARITNTGDADRSLYAFATLPGHARQEQLLTRLGPGQSVTRTFRFPGGARTLDTHPLRAGIRETDGPAMLTRRLAAEDRPLPPSPGILSAPSGPGST